MKQPTIRDWLPCDGRSQAWISNRRRSGPERYMATLPHGNSHLAPSEAAGAWLSLAKRIKDVTGVDLCESPQYFVWEALRTVASKIETGDTLPGKDSPHVILFEGVPSQAYLLDRLPLSLRDFPLPFIDLYIAPWPRLNRLAMLPHEADAGPFQLNLK